jgi:hypothetical protein
VGGVVFEEEEEDGEMEEDRGINGRTAGGGRFVFPVVAVVVFGGTRRLP